MFEIIVKKPFKPKNKEISFEITENKIENVDNFYIQDELFVTTSKNYIFKGNKKIGKLHSNITAIDVKTFIACGDKMGNLKVFKDKTIIRSFKEGEMKIDHIKFDRNDFNKFIACYADFSMKIFDIKNEKSIRKISFMKDHISGCELSDDYIFCWSFKKLFIYKISENKTIKEIDFEENIKDVSFSVGDFVICTEKNIYLNKYKIKYPGIKKVILSNKMILMRLNNNNIRVTDFFLDERFNDHFFDMTLIANKKDLRIKPEELIEKFNLQVKDIEEIEYKKLFAKNVKDCKMKNLKFSILGEKEIFSSFKNKKTFKNDEKEKVRGVIFKEEGHKHHEIELFEEKKCHLEVLMGRHEYRKAIRVAMQYEEDEDKIFSVFSFLLSNNNFHSILNNESTVFLILDFIEENIDDYYFHYIFSKIFSFILDNFFNGVYSYKLDQRIIEMNDVLKIEIDNLNNNALLLGIIDSFDFNENDKCLN